MANNPFDRMILNLRERPLSTDINQAQAQLDRGLREFLVHFLAARASDASLSEVISTAFLGTGFRLSPTSPTGMHLTLSPGLGFFYDPASTPSAISGIVGLDDLSALKPLPLMGPLDIAVPTAPVVPNSRIDILEVKYSRRVENPLTRAVLDPILGAFNPTLVNKTLAWALDEQLTINGTGAINYKTGTPGNPPVAPAVDAGYVQIGQVLVGSGVTTLDDDVIQDQRTIVGGPDGILVTGTYFVQEVGGGALTVAQQSIEAPPGVRVFIVPYSSLGYLTVKVIVLGQWTKMNAGITNSVEVDNVTQFGGIIPSTTTVQSSDALAINTSLVGYPAGLKIPEGAPCQSILIKCMKLSGGALVQAGQIGSGDDAHRQFWMRLR